MRQQTDLSSSPYTAQPYAQEISVTSPWGLILLAAAAFGAYTFLKSYKVVKKKARR